MENISSKLNGIKSSVITHTSNASQFCLARTILGRFQAMDKNMKKQTEKKADKGMSRTEFAQEYSMEHMHNNCNKNTKTEQQKAGKTK